MFAIGANAISRIAPDLGRVYLCPLCLEAFDESALDSRELTLEDVPPKAVGGRALVLTCKRCNNTSGTKLDREWRNRQDFLDFVEGRLSTPIKAQLLLGEHVLQVKMSHSGDQISLVGVPEATNPKATESVKTLMDSLVEADSWDGYDFQLKGLPFRPKHADLSILRMAYLVCFAIWGYRFTANGSCQLVRDQLQKPDDDIISAPVAFFDRSQPEHARQVLFVDEPVTAIMVIYGRHSALIPPPGAPDNPYEALAELSKPYTFWQRPVADWPASMELRLDYEG